jgi:hypothetical protein
MLLGRGARAQSRLQKLTTDDPPIPPAPRSCPQCASPLAYQYSYVGGGRERGAEQFDFYECATCGLFEYRPRTQKLRRVI